MECYTRIHHLDGAVRAPKLLQFELGEKPLPQATLLDGNKVMLFIVNFVLFGKRRFSFLGDRGFSSCFCLFL